MKSEAKLSRHQPVMVEQVVNFVVRSPGGIYVDGTVGGGGHARAILERLSPEGRLFCFDRDPAALDLARAALGSNDRLRFVHSSFADIESYLQPESVTGVLLDLGLSSDQLDSPRGFSYSRNLDLDMRFDPDTELTAQKIVNSYSVARLRQVLFNFGEEPMAPRIARRIVEARVSGAIRSTFQLADLVRSAVPKRFHVKALSRTFQSLRIEVNGEIEHIERGLEACWKTLQVGGVLCALGYHSIEDRRLKRFLASKAKGCICPPRLPVCVCGKKPSARLLKPSPLKPSSKEIRINPQSRSARLRAAEKIGTD